MGELTDFQTRALEAEVRYERLARAAKELVVWTAGMGGRIRDARYGVMDILEMTEKSDSAQGEKP